MPEGFVERIRRFMGLLAESIRRRIGLIRVHRIYCYEVRISGYVIPPEDVRKKERYRRTTCIQFELSFEERPYFRTFISDFKTAKERYEKELKELVEEQERRAIEEYAFRPTIPFDISKVKVHKKIIDKFLLYSSYDQQKIYEMSGGKIIAICGRPKFVVEAIDFEPVEFFDVEEGKIKEGKALDSAIFKLYRPLDEEPYKQWRIEFLHDL
ncbi:MAG: hypothetical protein NZ942_02890 [Candidatus Aenigmarchaeota archaeon]|nr:hypothetical protein [Candidatus Aenigmarchaeota archaeon]